MAYFLRSVGFRRLFLNPRRQTAYDHKCDQDGNENSQLKRVPHTHSPSPVNRPGWPNLAAVECPSISAGSIRHRAWPAVGPTQTEPLASSRPRPRPMLAAIDMVIQQGLGPRPCARRFPTRDCRPSAPPSDCDLVDKRRIIVRRPRTIDPL